MSITPLKKRTLGGELYRRDPKTEALLVELSSLSREELVSRAAIMQRTSPAYIPSECLIYLIRAEGRVNGDRWFEPLYKVLMERVLRSLPKAESPDGLRESLMRGTIRDSVADRLVELLLADRIEYSEKLDYFEIRFDGALANLRRDAQTQARRDESRSIPLEFDDETGEPADAVERAAGHFDPFAASDIDNPVYRSRLDAAIAALPQEQSLVIEMLRQGFPIDSKEGSTMTIAKALRRSEKTVRTYRDKAIAVLRAAVTEGADR